MSLIKLKYDYWSQNMTELGLHHTSAERWYLSGWCLATSVTVQHKWSDTSLIRVRNCSWYDTLGSAEPVSYTIWYDINLCLTRPGRAVLWSPPCVGVRWGWHGFTHQHILPPCGTPAQSLYSLINSSVTAFAKGFGTSWLRSLAASGASGSSYRPSYMAAYTADHTHHSLIHSHIII